MSDSDFIFEDGQPITVGSHGEHDFVYAAGDRVTDSGRSTLVFERGTGLGAALYDGFEDGDYTADPAWTVYLAEGDGTAEVIERSSPDGGSHALRVHESTGGRTAFQIGWQNGREGWDNAWSIEGLFYTANVSLTDPFQTHSVRPYYDGSGDLRIRLGHRDNDGNNVPFRIGGSLIDSVGSVDGMGGWATNTWYHYRVEHDGDGNYDGYCWVDGSGEPSSPNATASGSPPGGESRPAAININGSVYEDTYDMDHAFMRWG